MARPKLGSTETERLHLKITSEELVMIDDWRFGNRVPSRSEAVRRLVQSGLRADLASKQVMHQAERALKALLLTEEKMRTAQAGTSRSAMRAGLAVAIQEQLSAYRAAVAGYSEINAVWNAPSDESVGQLAERAESLVKTLGLEDEE